MRLQENPQISVNIHLAQCQRWCVIHVSKERPNFLTCIGEISFQMLETHFEDVNEVYSSA